MKRLATILFFSLCAKMLWAFPAVLMNTSGIIQMTNLTVTNLNVSGTLLVNGAAVAGNGVVTNNGSGYTLNLTGQFIGNLISTNGNVVTNTISPNGTNDSPAIQAAMIPFSYIRLMPFQTYILSNTIWATNNIIFDGQGSTLLFPRGLTNSMIDCGASNLNMTFENLLFNGQEMSNYNSASTIPVPLGLPEIYDSTSGSTGFSLRGSTVRNRNGLRFNANGGGRVSGCTFRGFSGCGLMLFNFNGTSSFDYTNATVDHCEADHDFIGFYDGGGYWDGIPAYGFGGGNYFNTTSFAYNSGEYAIIADSWAISCGIGFDWYAGNSSAHNCFAALNFIGFGLDTGPNTQHGSLIGDTANHNTYPGIAVTGGDLISGCIFYADTLPFIVANGEQLNFSGCQFSTTPAVIVTNPASLPNSWSSAYLAGCNTATPGAASYASVTSSNCSAFGFGNGNGITDDGSYNGKWSITNTTSTGSGVLSYLGATLPIYNSLVISSNWNVPIADWGFTASGQSPAGTLADSIYGLQAFPCVKLVGGAQYTYMFPQWVTNAVLALQVVWANAKPLYWTNFCEDTTFTNGGSLNTTFQPAYTLAANSITTILITNNFVETGTNQATKEFLLWTFFSATNTANTPCIIKATATATGNIQEGY